MIRRAYCIACGHVHRRDPETWTDRACCRCGGEVRFSGGTEHACTIVLRVPLTYDELERIGGQHVASGVLAGLLRSALRSES